MTDFTDNGRQLKLLAVIDKTTCEYLVIEVAPSFTAQDVIGALQYLFVVRGTPRHIRSDNGPEFVAKTVRRWRLDYDRHRIQNALNYQTLAVYAADCVLPASDTP